MNISDAAYRKLEDVVTLLKISYGLFFIVVGVDKFFNYIVNWHKYVSPYVLEYVDYTTLSYGVGVLEILLGLLVLTYWTRVGAYAIAVWIFVVIVNILSMKMYFDIAARDALLLVGAVALAMIDEVSHLVKHK